MNELSLNIIPKIGYGELLFGDSSEKVIKLLGQPEDVENIEDEDEFNTVILYYWDRGVSVFFEGKEKSVISCFETENQDSTLYDQEIFNMKEPEIINLMKNKGFEVAEVEMEMSGEKRVSYDDAMLDFFFVDGSLVAINWGVLVNDKGEIEEF